MNDSEETMTRPASGATETRIAWKAALETSHEDRDTPRSRTYWPEKDTWPRDRIHARCDVRTIV